MKTMTENIVQPISECLFSDEETNVYVVLDGASVPGLLPSLDNHEPEYVCLYRGELAPDMAEVAPYLVYLDPKSEFTDWIISQGWGNHWGIFAVSPADLREVRQHFRSFLTVYDAEGKPLLFRYYDPRVLRVYLPTCNAQELATVFGPVERYILEDEDANAMIQFRISSGSLQQERTQLEPD